MMNRPPATDAGVLPLVVTWCSARKKGPVGLALDRAPKRSQAIVQSEWRRLLATARGVEVATDLYVGRAFRLANAAAAGAGADLTVVSAGLGWVTGQTRIPAYDLTLAGGALARLIDGPLDTAAWWQSVRAGPFSTSPRSDLANRPLILACVSQEYRSFFAAELEQVPVSRLRIFGAGLSRKLPTSLLPALMPYDDRLDTVTGGTRADFAQRALRHFLFTLAPSGDLATDVTAVGNAMGDLPAVKATPSRQQQSDDELRSIIRSLLLTVGARRTPMLRHLRDALGIACEQRRFARLFDEMNT